MTGKVQIYFTSGAVSMMDKRPIKQFDFDNTLVGDSGDQVIPLYDLYGHSASYSSQRSAGFELLSWAVDMLCISPVARAMLRDAAEKEWDIRLEDDLGHEYCLYAEDKIIALSTENLSAHIIQSTPYYRHIFLVNFVRALRDVWHENRVDAFEENFTAESVLFLERMRAADIDVMAVYVAWELRGESNSAIWHHMIGSELGDMAMVYAAYLERDPTSHFTGCALKMCFATWHANELRVNKCDHDALCYMDSLIAEKAEEGAFGTQKATRLDVERLSCLPNTTAYLRGEGEDILNDPYFFGVQDEINQAHFMQIIDDQRVVRVKDIPFRSLDLARKIFPEDI